MKTGFTLVARLGSAGDRYPHILVDTHNWVLRLGPSYRRDERYYSSLPSLFEGMVEHFLRRRVSLAPVDGFEALAREIRAGIKDLRDLATTCLESLVKERQPLPQVAKRDPGSTLGTPSGVPAPVIAFPARKLIGNGNG
jgi:hypothetical protein